MVENYSVLMSVYYKEKPENLAESMDSIYRQTIPTNDFVLICDGPLNDELDTVIDKEQEKFGDVLRVYRLEKNVGLGNALNIGIHHCKNELVARMDSDDISRDDRCEKQLDMFLKNSKLSIVSGIVEEFSLDMNKVEARRVIPEFQQDIVEFAKHRNPFNHPCVMYKKSAVELAGGYKDFFLLEDYYLWVRMLQKGVVGYNIQEPLLWMRSGSSMYQRRGGWKYFSSQYKLFKYMRESKFITEGQYLSQIIFRIGASVIPNRLRKQVYKLLLRR